MLPRSLVAQLDLDKLEVVEGSFVSKELRLRHTDLLFRVPFRTPRKGQRYVYVYVLLEHQSKTDPDMPFRVLEYVVRIWAKLRADEPHRGTLPLVVPLVVHHGARAWSAPRSVHEMVEGLAEHPELQRFVPNLDLPIDDLAVASDAELMNRPLAPVARVAPGCCATGAMSTPSSPTWSTGPRCWPWWPSSTQMKSKRCCAEYC